MWAHVPAGSDITRERPRVLVAPDAFKGTFDAPAVAAAIARGLRSAGARAQECPVADGGEGTLSILLGALGGEQVPARARGPLGEELESTWGMLPDGGAVVEAAAASGLALLPERRRDAVRASTAGTGELILAAAAAGADPITVAVGGTATTDGGAGALAAIESGGGIGGARIRVACDVEIPFERAAAEFAPQKGASPAAVRQLAERLREVAGHLPRDPRGVPRTGAGGGLAGGLWAALGAELCAGADLVLDALGFDDLLANADAVIVGEGRFDAQSLQGKAASAVLARARSRGLPVHLVAGSFEPAAARRAGLASIRSAGTIEELEGAGGELARDLLRAHGER